MKMPLPQNKTELALLAKWYFGKELHLDNLSVSPCGGSYSVSESYNSYNGNGWLFGSNCIDGYDYSARFWRIVLGELTCGGIARNSYGQFKFSGRRHFKRLQNLQNSLHSNVPDTVRPVFERLASQHRAKREWKKSR